MPDAALKQYAMMHKNDPYTMSLAMSESNRRKQIREGAAPQVGQQPTVVDQELSQMGVPQMPQGQAQAMPEDSGIGALPQQPMTMAEGGIVAFKDEGAVVDSYATDRASEEVRRAKEFEQYKKDSAIRASADPLGLAGMLSGAYTGTKNWLTATPAAVVPSAGANAAQSAAMAQLSAGAQSPDQYPTQTNDPRYPGNYVAGNLVAPAAASADTTKGGLADVAAKQKELATASTTPRAAAPAAPAQSLIERYEDIKSQLGTADPYATQRNAVGAAGITAKQEALTAIEADNTKFANILKGKEAGLANRAASILKQSDTNTGLAFLNAGLSIMSTPGSLATAIGKGAKVGTESFAAGLDKINAAKDKLAEAQDRLEDLKINRAEMSAKEIRAAKAGINDAKVAALGMTLDGMEKAGVRNQAAGLAILHGAVQESTNAASNQAHITAAGIAAAPGLERNRLLAAAQDTEAKVRKDYGTLQTKVMADLSKDPTYSLEQDPIKKTAIYNNALRNALQNNPFLSQYAGNVGFGGSSGKVRELAGVDEAD